MLVSLAILLPMTAGGLALTYLFADAKPLLWRAAAGCVMGTALCGTAALLLGSTFGLSTVTAVGAVFFALAPAALFTKDEIRGELRSDWNRAKGRMQGSDSRRLLRFCYYAFFLILFLAFFSRAMYETPQGIFTGGSQNLGDLPFHLGAITGFTEGQNFPPDNPSFAGARFSYPFVADLATAVFAKLGAGVADAIFVQDAAWAFALLILLLHFVLDLTGDRKAAFFGPPLLLFSGGLGFVAFFSDFVAQGKGLFDFLSHLPTDYTIGERFRWGNAMVVMFITQRSILLGLPLTLIVLDRLWRVFTAESRNRGEDERGGELLSRDDVGVLICGMMAGMLPLVHLHSLFVLFIVCVFLVLFRPDLIRTWLTFAAGVALIAGPELLWSLSGTANEAGKFFDWHLGWDRGQQNFVWFWLTNTGVLIPTVVLGLWLVYSTKGNHEKGLKDAKGQKHHGAKSSPLIIHPSSLLTFYLPFVLLFVLCNVAKLAPWEWDNIKVLVYWFVGSIPFAALGLAWLWRKGRTFAAVSLVLLMTLTLSGALDVWRTTSRQINYQVFDKDAVGVAESIKKQTRPQALFLNAPTYNTPIALTGRRSLMRYTGHLSSHGIDYGQREADVKEMYLGGPRSLPLMQQYGIEYVLVGPEERRLGANEPYFSRFPAAFSTGQYKVYSIR
jgi:hypothetical protein